MTQEEKELLLRDLCARLPYGVIVKYKSQESEGQIKLGYGNIEYVAELGRGWWIDCKPYLRLMSSMTEEEERELRILWNEDLIGERSPFYIYPCYSKTLDFYNSHHFDYRGLIEKGLALEAPKDMYK